MNPFSRALPVVERVERAARLHRLHWLILGVSVALTCVGYLYARDLAQSRLEARFEREIENLVDLVVVRMTRYEDALWAGVGHLSGEPPPSASAWRAYVQRVGVVDKYPGILGLGVVTAVSRDQAPAFLAQARLERPEFRIHPDHGAPDLLPITHIEPVAANRQAVGLDLAHERNRRQAAQRAAETGRAQITGPIVLVQDAGRTPGFLFCAPFYGVESGARRGPFRGLVYAPFIFSHLLAGVLAQGRRGLTLRLRDGDAVLVDEFAEAGVELDPDPIYERSVDVDMYGRRWTFDVATNRAFREQSGLAQPIYFLIAAVFVDALLLWFFAELTAANRRAFAYAEAVTADLRRNREALRQTNDELQQFNYRTSHDLVAPLRTIKGYVNLARDDIEQGNTSTALSWFDPIEHQVERLVGLVRDLLALTRAGDDGGEREPIDFTALVDEITQGLRASIDEYKVQVTHTCALVPPLRSERVRIRQILENLIANAVVHSDPSTSRRRVIVRAERHGGVVLIEVADNGVGVPLEIQQKVFEMFFRGRTGDRPGSGLGLYLVKKHVAALGGWIEIESEGKGTLVRVSLPEEFPC